MFNLRVLQLQRLRPVQRTVSCENTWDIPLLFLWSLCNLLCLFFFNFVSICRMTDRSSTSTWCTRATSCLWWSSQCSVTQSSRADRGRYGKPTWTTALRRYADTQWVSEGCAPAAGFNYKGRYFCCRWRCQRVSKLESQSCVITVTWTYGQERGGIYIYTSCLLNPGNTKRDMRALWMHYFCNVGFLQPKIYKCLFPVV